jgi:hypothetical protein
VKNSTALRLSTLALAIGMLAGCGASGYQPQHVTSSYVYDPHTSDFGLRSAPETVFERPSSWVKSDATKIPLLYISSGMSRDLNMFSYPQGTPEGVVRGINLPNGICSDAKGNIFAPEETSGDILEFAHGGTTPIAKLLDQHWDPYSCSFDPKSRTLAVVAVTNAALTAGSIALYRNETGSPTIIQPSNMRIVINCGFDDKGNLFVDGWTNLESYGGVFIYEVFPVGKSAPKVIKLAKKIAEPGAIQWDGKYLTIADASNGILYRTNGIGGKIESTVTLAGASNDYGTFIQGDTVIVPSFYSIHAGFWHYPSGGSEFQKVKVGEPYSATISAVGK